jgi:hypothetical protein
MASDKWWTVRVGKHELFHGNMTGGYQKATMPDGRQRYVHRIAMTAWLEGMLDPFLVVDHTCRWPTCVAIDHLELVDNDENIARGDWDAAASAKYRGECRNGHVMDGRYCMICRKAQRDGTQILIYAARSKLRLSHRDYVALYGMSRDAANKVLGGR